MSRVWGTSTLTKESAMTQQESDENQASGAPGEKLLLEQFPRPVISLHSSVVAAVVLR